MFVQQIKESCRNNWKTETFQFKCEERYLLLTV